MTESDMALLARPNIAEILRGSTSSSNSVRLQRLSASLSWRQSQQKAKTYQYEFNDLQVLEIEQIMNGEDTGLGTGTFVWPAAHVLAKFIEKHSSALKVPSRRICELGSGTGLVGLVATKLGAAVTMTDQEQVMELLRRNIARMTPNTLSRVVACTYDWGKSVESLSPPFDVIIVSDCILPKLYPMEPLVKALDVLISAESIALISYEHRTYPDFDPRYEFYRLAALCGLNVHVIPLEMHDSIYNAEDIEIWAVYRNGFSPRCPVSFWTQTGQSSLVFKTWGDTEFVTGTMKSRVEASAVDFLIKQKPTGTTGSYIWPGSVILSRYLLNKTEFRHSVAVDIGSGCGLNVLALLASGFSHVIATDREVHAPLLKDNLDMFVNSSARRFSIVDCDWSNPRDSYTKIRSLIAENNNGIEYPTTIVCSECLYTSASAEPLLEAIDALSGLTTEILVCNQHRSALERFLSCIRYRKSFQRQYRVESIPLTIPDLEIKRDVDGIVISPPLSFFRIVLLSQGMTSVRLSQGRVSLNFYPKFENSDMKKNVDANLIRISVKHSGSLILFGGQKGGMVFCHSKNSSCNDFTRVFMILLKDYFDRVWPNDPSKFLELCDYLYKNIICLSFEMVVKDRLGQHGAAPNAAYFVLTAISAPCAESAGCKRVFLSPIDITIFATRWRLPVNTEWWLPVRDKALVSQISQLFENWRWMATWSKVDSVISEFAEKNGGVKLQFLSHGLTQGEVLEGLVCQQLCIVDDKIAEYRAKVQEYNEIMRPFRTEVLNSALAMNLYVCSKDIEDALQQPCGGTTVAIDCKEMSLREPVPRKDLEQEEIWVLLIQYDTAYERLRLVYGQFVTLRGFTYNDRLSVIVEIRNDDVFKFFPMHGLGLSLFRGMVLDFGREPREPEEFLIENEFNIQDIVKIKCLGYIIRTFGVRNNLGRLFKDGEDAISSMIQHFVVNWSVPLAHRPAVETFLAATYKYLLSLPDESKEDAKNNYLQYFETFFSSGDPATIPIRTLLGLNIVAPVDGWFTHTFSNLFVCNFSDETVTSDSFTAKYGINISSSKIASMPPGNKAKDGSVVVVFPPPAGDALKQKMFDGMLKWALSFESRDIRNKLLVSPTRDDLIMAIEATRIQVHKDTIINTVSVVIFPGWCVAAGKSTHTEALSREYGYTVVSSDDCRARGTVFGDAVVKVIKEGAKNIVLDKNIPNDDGLRSMLKMLDDAQKKTSSSILITATVPTELQHVEFYEERIQKRSGTDHCFRPEAVGSDWLETFRSVFYYPSVSFRATFQSLPGAVLVDPRNSPLENAKTIVESIPVPCKNLRSFERNGLAYVAAFLNDFPGHVTLSHQSDNIDLFKEMKKLSGTSLCVSLDKYLYAEEVDRDGNIIEGGHKIGVFVVTIEGAPPGIPHNDLYHLTDQGTLMFKTKPVMAKSVMSQYRGYNAEFSGLRWEITELEVGKTIYPAMVRVSSAIL